MRLNLSAIDIILIVVYAILLVPHLVAAWQGSVISVAFAAQNLAVIALLLVHRPTRSAAGTWSLDTVLGWLGTLTPLLLQAGPGEPWSRWGAPIAFVGAGLSVVAILSLGRSMGMEPANRGIQVAWMYRIVRHPIYATYLIAVGGFLLAFPSVINVAIAILWLGFQVARIVREEAHLSTDPEYLRYRDHVRYRLIPPIW